MGPEQLNEMYRKELAEAAKRNEENIELNKALKAQLEAVGKQVATLETQRAATTAAENMVEKFGAANVQAFEKGLEEAKDKNYVQHFRDLFDAGYANYCETQKVEPKPQVHMNKSTMIWSAIGAAFGTAVVAVATGVICNRSGRAAGRREIIEAEFEAALNDSKTGFNMKFDDPEGREYRISVDSDAPISTESSSNGVTVH